MERIGQLDSPSGQKQGCGDGLWIFNLHMVQANELREGGDDCWVVESVNAGKTQAVSSHSYGRL